MSENAVDAYLSTVQAFWPSSPEPRLHRSRGSRHAQNGGLASFLVLPDATSPRMLVPARNPVAGARAMHRFSAALSVSDAVKRLAVSSLLRGRTGFVFPHRIDVSDQAVSLQAWLGDLFGEPVDFSVALGTARANRKPVLQVFDGRGRSLGFAKVGSTVLAERYVKAEAHGLELLEKVDLPAGLEVPRLLHTGYWQDTFVLVMTALETSLWQRPSRQWDLPVAEMAAFHGAFAAMLSVPDAAVTEMPLWGSLTDAGASLAAGTTRDRFQEALATLGSRAGDCSLPVGAWHGDWTPWNMSRRRNLLQLWDWERLETGAPPGLDRCHYGVNAVSRRDGISVDSVFAGLRLAGIDPASADRRERLVAATYLAAITGRYLVGAETELGEAVRPASRVMLDALQRWLAEAMR